MKITLEIPDTSLAAAINFVYVEEDGKMMIATRTADTKTLRSGEVIIIPPEKKEE